MSHNKSIHAVLYTKPSCMPCMMTHKLLDSKNIPYVETYNGDDAKTNVIDVLSTDPAKRKWSIAKVEKIKNKYLIQALPLIKVVDDETGKVLDFWSGFRPNRIKKWFE